MTYSELQKNYEAQVGLRGPSGVKYFVRSLRIKLSDVVVIR